MKYDPYRSIDPLYLPQDEKKKKHMIWPIVASIEALLIVALILVVVFVKNPEPLFKNPSVPNMPVASDNFDCDDSALFMYNYFILYEMLVC